MISKRRIGIIVGSILVGSLLLASVLHLLPLNILSVQQKPGQAPQKVHDYYIIVEEKTGEELMYVPLVVSVGDEMISEDNKRYKIVKVEANRAYARFVEDVKLPQKETKPDG